MSVCDLHFLFLSKSMLSIFVCACWMHLDVSFTLQMNENRPPLNHSSYSVQVNPSFSVAWPPLFCLGAEDTGEVCLCPPEAGGSEQLRRSPGLSFPQLHGEEGCCLSAPSLPAPSFLAPLLLVQRSDSGSVATNLGPGDSAPGS